MTAIRGQRKVRDQVFLTGAGISDHTLLTNIGTNTHPQIDTHIADTSIHGTAVADGTATNNTLRWSGSAWVESSNLVNNASFGITLKYQNQLRLTTVNPGVTIVTSASADVTLEISSDGASNDAIVILTNNINGSGRLFMKGTTGTLSIQQTNPSGGVFQDNWITMVKNGSVSLYNNGTIAFATDARGAIVTGSFDADDPTMFWRESLTDRAQIRYDISSNRFEVQTIEAGAQFRVVLRNSADSSNEVAITCVADGAVFIAYNGVTRFETTNEGLDVFTGTGAALLDVIGNLVNNDSTIGTRGFSGGAAWYWDDSAVTAKIQQTTASGALQDNWITMVRNGAVSLFFNGILEASTKSGGFLIDDELEIDGALNHDGSTAGFFATAPVARPTGVAVTAIGIHAALVTLGLITA